MSNISTDRITVLLVCPPGLEQKSLYTAINAVPKAAVIARVPNMEAALKITGLRKPDMLVIMARSLGEEMVQLLNRIKQLHPAIICVVLVTTSRQKQLGLESGVDFVLDPNDLNREFPHIVEHVRAEIQARIVP